MRHWPVIVAAACVIAGICGAAFARPFTDPRSERSDAIDQNAALEPRDPACQARTLVAAGGAFPRNPHTLAVRWVGFANFELAYNGRIILLDAYYDRGSTFPPLGVKAADIKSANLMLLGHGHFDHMSDAASIAARTKATVVGAPPTTDKLRTQPIPAQQIRSVTGRGGEVLKFDNFTVEPILGRHGEPSKQITEVMEHALTQLMPAPSAEQQGEIAGIRARGKSVLIFNHEPQESDPASVFNGIGNTRYANNNYKLFNAQRHGAIAVLAMPDPNHQGPQRRVTAATARLSPQALADGGPVIPLFTVGGRISDTLFAAAGKRASEVQSSIDAQAAPASFDIPGVRVDLHTATATRRRGTSYNVAGWIEGSDPALKEETIVFSGHFDHEGAGPTGVYHGADDNGSGTVGVVALRVIGRLTVSLPDACDESMLPVRVTAFPPIVYPLAAIVTAAKLVPAVRSLLFVRFAAPDGSIRHRVLQKAVRVLRVWKSGGLREILRRTVKRLGWRKG